MKRGDIIINPWVSKDIDGKPNPMYATIYLGDNCSVDFKGRKLYWADKVFAENPASKCPWKVVGHVDIDKLLFEQISSFISKAEE